MLEDYLLLVFTISSGWIERNKICRFCVFAKIKNIFERYLEYLGDLFSHRETNQYKNNSDRGVKTWLVEKRKDTSKSISKTRE